jgi:hypothetical protein
MIEDAAFFEIDRAKLNDNFHMAAQNAVVLQNHATQLLRNLRSSAHLFPPTLRHFLNVLHRKVKVRFPGFEWEMYSSMIFLRFVVPNLIVPHNASKLPIGLRKSLLRIGKLLQSCANGVHFYEGDAEAVFNVWLSRQEPLDARLFGDYTAQPHTQGRMTCWQQHRRAANKRDCRRCSKARKQQQQEQQQHRLLKVTTCQLLAANRHAFVAALQACDDTKGKHEWVLVTLETLKAF